MGENSQSHKEPMETFELSAGRLDIQDIYSLEFDGASKGNPGRAGAGAILKRPDGTVLCELTKGVGIASGNIAEYEALIMGLQEALNRGICHIKAQGDSKLVCSQVMGSWKVKSLNLSSSFLEAMKLKERFQSFSIQHVYRKFNSAADALANTAIGLPVGEPQVVSNTSSDFNKGAKVTQGSCDLEDIPLRSTKVTGLPQEDNEKFYCMVYHGASKGKHASAAAVLYSPDGTLHFKISQRLGIASGNVARYQALVIGLRAALEHNISHIKIQGDALLVFKQMTGIVKVKDERLQALSREANDLLTSFSDFYFTHVDKCQNLVARALAEAALQSPGGSRADAGLVRMSSRNDRSIIGDGERLQIQTCAGGDGALIKIGNPLGPSVKSLHIAACPQVPTPCAASFFPSYRRQESRVPRIKVPHPLPSSTVMSKSLPVYAANSSIHRIVLRCASKRVRINPHILQCSLMHMQAGGMYKSAVSTSIFR